MLRNKHQNRLILAYFRARALTQIPCSLFWLISALTKSLNGNEQSNKKFSHVILLLLHFELMISKVNHAQNTSFYTVFGTKITRNHSTCANRNPATPLNLHHILPVT